MFSDPQFWVAVSFVLFILAIFNPVRKQLTASLDTQINEIKIKIEEAESLKNEAQKTLNEIRKRESFVEQEITNLNLDTEDKIKKLEEISSKKINEQIEKKKILAENKIDQLLREAKLSIKNYISVNSIETAKFLLQNKLSKDNHNSIIGESINELSKVLKN